MFIILSQQRSGTHYLQSLLASHPRIETRGEILHAAAETGSFYSFWQEKAAEDPVVVRPFHFLGLWRAYLARLKKGVGPDCRLVGVVMCDQVELLPAVMAEQVLSFPTIHLVRENVLRTYVSSYLHFTTKKPMHSAKEGPLDRLHLPVDNLLHELRLRSRRIAAHRGRLRNVEHIEVSYESLSTPTLALKPRGRPSSLRSSRISFLLISNGAIPIR